MTKRNKVIKTYSIDKDEFEIFKKNCADKCLNISRFISNKIKEYNEMINEENNKKIMRNK